MNGRRDARETAAEPRCGGLVIGHGTRSATGIAEFHAVVKQLALRLTPMPVEPCFLELAEPTIAVGVERLLARGAERLVVAPLLLFAAGHAKDDIPAALITCPAAADRGLRWTQTKPLGLHERLVELSVLRYDEACRAGPAIDDADTLLLMVGRGAADAEAIAEMQRFVALRSAARPVAAVELAFTALAEPLVESVLPRIAASPYRRIVVQPHLLFAGQLLDRLRSQVATIAAATPSQHWTMTDHLGPHPWVVDALAERITGIAATG